MKIHITLIGLFLLFQAFFTFAEEIQYPVPAYDGEELETVREWEKNWAGKKITPENIDGVKEFVPATFLQIMKNTQLWGESWFEIVPYKEVKPSKGEIKLTRKYAGTCKIADDDKLIGYVSGIPFPRPKTGLEMAHNFDNHNTGDNCNAFEDMYLINGKSRYDRKMSLEVKFLYFSGRREIPPVPEILPNKKNIYMATHLEYSEPASMRGSRSIHIKFKDRTLDAEMYSWSSTARKVTRKSTAQKESTQGGSDASSDDQNVYDNAIPFMSYNFVGRKELLLARNQDVELLKKGHTEGYCIFNGFQRERIKTYAVECTHKNPKYLYSKQVWYIDPETWYILYADKYDRQGTLWRVFENANVVVESSYNNERIGTIGFVSILDVKQLHGTGGFGNYEIGGTGKYYQPEYYTQDALLKYGY